MGREDRRREPRYPVRNSELISVSVRQGSERASEPMLAELCDLSRGGAKLLLPKALKLHECASLVLQSRALGLDLALSAEVCWIAEHDGKWSLGFEFAPRVPVAVLDKLLENKVIERRIHRRQTKRIPVTARWESDPTDHPALLWDVSPGGFCILSPSKATRRVRIKPECRAMEIPGATQWEIGIAGGYVVGCKFLESDSFTLLRSLDAEPDSTRAEEATVCSPTVKKRLHGLLDLFFKRHGRFRDN